MSAAHINFTGKTDPITGASGGIGREMARMFHAAGARLVLLDLQEESLLELPQNCGRGLHLHEDR